MHRPGPGSFKVISHGHCPLSPWAHNQFLQGQSVRTYRFGTKCAMMHSLEDLIAGPCQLKR